jgi:hypothetical protein
MPIGPYHQKCTSLTTLQIQQIYAENSGHPYHSPELASTKPSSLSTQPTPKVTKSQKGKKMITTGGLFTALIVDSVIFAVLFGLFSIYRKYRSQRVYGAENQPAYYEAEIPMKAMLGKVYAYSQEEMLEHSKHEGWMYLSLYKSAFKGTAVAAVLAMAILVPTYLSGDNNVENSVDELGIAHVLGNDLLMISPVLCVPIFSAIFYLVIYAHYRESKQHTIYSVSLTQTDDRPSYDQFTVEINGLPTNIPPAELGPKLESFLQSEFPESVQSCYVVPDYTEMYQCQIKLDKLQEKLGHYKEYELM